MKKLAIVALALASAAGIYAQGYGTVNMKTTTNNDGFGRVTYGESCGELAGTYVPVDYVSVLYYKDAIVTTGSFGSSRAGDPNGTIKGSSSSVITSELLPAGTEVEFVVGAYSSWVEGATTEAEGSAGAMYVGKSDSFTYSTGDSSNPTVMPDAELMMPNFSVEIVPEPTTIALGILGLGGLFLLRRRS